MGGAGMFEHLDILDERHVNIVAEAIASDRITCAVEDVFSTSANSETLYGECLARLTGPDGHIYPASAFVPCLDAWRETPVLDRHVLKLALDHLDADPAKVLGCNISADNFTSTTAWSGIRNRILDRAYLAPRLVLELTEVQPLGALSFCADAITELQNIGCRIALDDFGTGFASPRLLQMINFDIVKIDRAFVHDIRSSHNGRDSLQNMVGLASSFASFIVVEGVETAAQLDAARTAGASHVQGHFFSVPVQHSAYRNILEV